MSIEEILASPIFWILFGAGSEIIALLPIKSNNWVQLLLQTVYSLKPKKKS